MNKPIIPGSFVNDIKLIIGQARTQAVRSVEFHRVEMYWKLGERIFEEEQQGKERADYGTYLIRNLATELEPEFGSGFSVRTLEQSRQFYRAFPIANALRSQLNWTQYRMLLQIEDGSKREYYELEAAKNSWTGRELERQINSGLFERLLLSNDKESVMAVARSQRLPELPHEIVKDPMISFFLLCAKKNNEMVKLSLPQNNRSIMASQYQLYLPSESQLLDELKKENYNEELRRLSDEQE